MRGPMARIGIAGCGAHALARILPVIETSPRLQLAAVWTRSETTRALLRERGVAGVTGDWERFLDAEMDVVYVASPTGLHFEHAAAILQAGFHAWVEKPLAASLQEVRSLLEMAQRGQRMLAEAFMFPWHPQAGAIVETLGSGDIGEPRLASLTFCFPHLSADNFRYDPQLGGGAFLDHACYLVKALDCYLGGDWALLGGCIDQEGRAVDVAGAAQLRRSPDGLLADLNWGFGRSYVNEMQLVGSAGRLLVESAFTKPASRSCDLVLEDARGGRATRTVGAPDGFRLMIEGFVEQLGDPACWDGLRRDLLRHAERFFALHAGLTRYH